MTLLVTCYVEADAYHDSSRKALNQRQDTVMGLFAQGFFQVEDRALTVQANRGLGNPDFAEVSAVFQWMDARPGYQDPEAADTPKMEHFAIDELRFGAREDDTMATNRAAQPDDHFPGGRPAGGNR